MRQRILVIGFLLTCLALTSCSSLYHRQWRTAEPERTANVSMRFLEVDDEGWFWDRSQAEGVFREIDERVKERDTMVVTFIHGWHHCAECCDGNVEGFRETLNQLQRALDDRNFNVIGLYVGWRGKSLPMPLDYGTFWGRKAAAERVGQNDLKEFFSRLQRTFETYRPDIVRNEEAPSTTPGTHFLGMVSIGHSFGGQVLLKAVSESIESQLIAINPRPAYLLGAQPAARDPQQEASVTGFGDLVVLINPAAEASQFHRLHMLSQGLNYSPKQTPIVLTVSAENDRARHFLFKLGRILGEFFTGKPHKDDEIQRTVEREALGVYGSHITHELQPIDKDVELKKVSRERHATECTNSGRCTYDWYEWKKPPEKSAPDSLVTKNPPGLKDYDFSGEVVFGNVRLKPLDTTAAPIRQPHQSLIVARTNPKIIDNHSGIFTKPFLDFVVPYVTYIERKSRQNMEVNRELRTMQKRKS